MKKNMKKKKNELISSWIISKQISSIPDLVNVECRLETTVPLFLSNKQALVFTGLQYKSFENTVGKEEIARNEQFLLFPQCFLPVWRTFSHFHQN